MFVVLEFNQASGTPSIYDTDIYETRDEAEVQAAEARERLRASGSGRRERYSVAEVTFAGCDCGCEDSHA